MPANVNDSNAFQPQTEKPKGAKLPTFRLFIEFALLWTAVAGAVTVPYLPFDKSNTRRCTESLSAYPCYTFIIAKNAENVKLFCEYFSIISRTVFNGPPPYLRPKLRKELGNSFVILEAQPPSFFIYKTFSLFQKQYKLLPLKPPFLYCPKRQNSPFTAHGFYQL